MADIQFEEEQQFQRYGQAEQKPFMIRLVLRTGIVSTEQQAKYVLICVAVFLILMSVVIFSVGGGAQDTSQMDTGRTLDQSQYTQFQ